MKTRINTAVAVVAALLAVTLSGCGEDSATSSEESAGVQSRSQSVETETPEPLVAETPSEEANDVDAEFVDYVRSELALLPSTGIANATDAQLVEAGNEACKQLISGADSESIRLIEGEQPSASGYYMDSGTIIDGARRFYCPETIY